MVRIQSKVVLGLIASLSLSACGQGPAPVEASPYANGADYPWTYVQPETQLSVQTLTPGENTLYYEPILSATNGWGPLEIDRSNGEQGANDGRTITLNGVTYKKGLGVHAGSDVRYSLRGTGASCVRFSADIGVDDEVGRRGSVVFQVYLDDFKAFDSGTMTGYSATKKFSLDITGRRQLRLVVTDAGDNKHYDHADWANPRITCIAATTGPSGSPDPGFGVAGRAPVGGVDSVVEPGDSVVTLGSDFTLRRLSSSGVLIGTGAVVLPAGARASGLARQSNGNLVAVGTGNGQVVVTRFLPNLQPDPGFGAAGAVQLQFGLPSGQSVPASSEGRDVAVQADGKIVIVGGASRPINLTGVDFTTADFLTARLLSGGQLDPAFGSSGAVIISGDDLAPSPSASPKQDSLTAVAIQPDGRIVATGGSEFTGSYDPFVFRVLPDGRLDSSFSGNGVSSGFTVSSDYGLLPRALALQADGRMLIGGGAERFQTAAFVSRINADGSADTGRKFQLADDHTEVGTVHSLAAQRDGRVVFGGRTPSGSIVGRLNSALAPDTTFGSSGSGTVLVSPATAAAPYPVVLSVQTDSQGRSVATSSLLNGPPAPAETVRLLP